MFSKLISFCLLVCISISCVCCRKREPYAASRSSVFRISSENDIQTLDPRQARDLLTATFIHTLYEGLTRLDADGQPLPALAESIKISPDQKTYTFILRESAWSNGIPVTAYDFAETWKSILDPQFPAPNAYQLYVIKGAKAAKEGKISLNEVGIHVVDPKTLIVELETPAPYFLHLTSAYFYYPTSPSMRQNPLADKQAPENTFAFNGPFTMQKWSKQNEFVAVKNVHYWDADAIHLDQIHFIVLDNTTALKLFEMDELDWTGSPLSTISADALATLRQSSNLQIQPAAGTTWLRLNTKIAPFDQVDMRRAFSLALNRHDLVEHVLQGSQIPAMGLLPPVLTSQAPLFQDDDIQEARKLFQQAIIQSPLMTPITVCYASGERNHKIAQVAQQQWKQVLGVDVQLQSCEPKLYYEKLKNHDYQISIGSWFADIRDPISFLDVFRSKDNGTNNTQWENPQYITLLSRSSQETGSQREHILQEAERLLMQDMPIIPIFYSAFNYLKKPYVKGVYLSELGYLDFKHAYLDH